MEIMEDNHQYDNHNSERESPNGNPQPKKNYNCELCDLKIKNPTSLVNHMEKDHQGKKINCQICITDFETGELFLNHVKSVHKKKKIIKGHYPCVECGKIFFENCRLTMHINAVHHIKVSVCEICSKECKNGYQLKQHIVNVHKEVDNVVCDKCSKVFKNKIKLYSHKQAVHEAEGKEDIICDNCGKAFVNEYKLKRHLKRVCRNTAKEKVERKIFCDLCNRKFYELEELVLHNEMQHTPVSCQVCRKEFKSKEKYRIKQHLERCHIILEKEPTMTCQVCQKEIKTVVHFRRHLKRMHSIHDPNHILSLIKEIKPDYQSLSKEEHVSVEAAPEEKEKSNDLLTEHQIKRKELVKQWREMEKEQNEKEDYKTDFGDESKEDYNPVLIPKCEVKIEASDESDNEFLEESLSFKENGSEVHKCDECNKSFLQIQNLFDHVKTVHIYEPCPCPFCEGKTLKNQTHLEQHLKQFHKDDINKKEIKEMVEEINNEVGINDVKLSKVKMEAADFETKQQSVKTEQSSEGGQPPTCPTCDKQFANEYRLRKHRRQSAKCCPVDEAISVNCEKCGKKLANKYCLRKHLQRSVDCGVAKTRVCTTCSKEFASHTLLKKHRRQSVKCCPVDEAKCAICEECGKDFVNKYLLGCHIRTVHASEHENKVCQGCGKEFNTSFNLKRHLKRSTKCSGEDAISVICQECGKDFANKYMLGYHIKTVHSGEDEDKVCLMCTKEFKTSFSLKQHLKRSSKCSDGDAKSVNCDECGKEFVDEDRLKKHHRESRCMMDGTKSVICPECGKEFANKRQAYIHHSNVHLIENVNCNICGRTYRNRIALRRHIKHSHDGMVKNPYTKGIGQKSLPSTPEVDVSIFQTPPTYPPTPPTWTHPYWPHPLGHTPSPRQHPLDQAKSWQHPLEQPKPSHVKTEEMQI